MNYYNDHEPYVAQWLKNLVAAGMLPAGDVDSRPIQEVTPNDLAGYTQCHFFAGIGGWSFALQLAGWRADEPVWTGSCPCQPYSVAGKGAGDNDPRNLWPEFRRLIKKCGPSVVFGEQVASRDGRVWFAGVRSDLEALGYAVGGADLCAAGIGAPHIRQRLWWVADAGGTECDGRPEPGREYGGALYAANCGGFGGLAHCEGLRRGEEHTNDAGRGERIQTQGQARRIAEHRDVGRLADLCSEGLQGWEEQPAWEECPSAERGGAIVAPSWGESTIIPCADGKARRIESGLAPLVDGFPGRAGQIRAFGNAIVPPLAAMFISAFLAARP